MLSLARGLSSGPLSISAAAAGQDKPTKAGVAKSPSTLDTLSAKAGPRSIGYDRREGNHVLTARFTANPHVASPQTSLHPRVGGLLGMHESWHFEQCPNMQSAHKRILYLIMDLITVLDYVAGEHPCVRVYRRHQSRRHSSHSNLGPNPNTKKGGNSGYRSPEINDLWLR